MTQTLASHQNDSYKILFPMPNHLLRTDVQRWETLERELKRIATAMEGNGYLKQFTEKAISRQLKRPAVEKFERVIDGPDQPKMEIARIPYVDGLSQEIRRIARTAGVRCSLFMPNTLRSLYQAKDSLPQETTTNAVYSASHVLHVTE